MVVVVAVVMVVVVVVVVVVVPRAATGARLAWSSPRALSTSKWATKLSPRPSAEP